MTSSPNSRAELMVAIEAADGAGERLAAVLATVPVASIIVRPAAGRALAAADLVPLVAIGQKAGTAVLLQDDARLARTVKADGVHLGVSETIVDQLHEARAVLGGRAAVGADAGRSRDDAMTLGEAGADYVAFGIPAFVKDRETAFDRQLDLVAWWAEIFEVPCVGMDAASAEQAGALAAAGVDFVCLGLSGGVTVADAVDMARNWLVAINDAGRPELVPGKEGEA